MAMGLDEPGIVVDGIIGLSDMFAVLSDWLFLMWDLAGLSAWVQQMSEVLSLCESLTQCLASDECDPFTRQIL